MNQAYQFKRLAEEDFPDRLIPDLLEFYKFSPQRYPFFLESSSGDSTSSAHQQSRYDILFIEPEYWLKLNKHFILSSSENLSLDNAQTFLEAFDELWRREQKAAQASAIELPAKQQDEPFIPFSGGWFVFFSYEMAQQVEPTLKLPVPQGDLPLAYAARVATAIVRDYVNRQCYLVAENKLNIDNCYQQLIQDIQQSRSESQNKNQHGDPNSAQSSELQSRNKPLTFAHLHEDAGNDFILSAAKVSHYIREGDVFQVNLSRLWHTHQVQPVKYGMHSLTAWSLYQSLRKTNPAPFSGLVSFLDSGSKISIISSSPERLLKVRNNIIESRPIAGTRPRSSSALQDKRLLEELHTNPKEQAEHVMLIDLIRNDLGRVCESGTVRVNEFMLNESYAHVHHIVSNIVGQKQPDKTPGQVIKAIFPGGTITGCPKVRCMEIIAELEKVARGPYTGSLGYINLDGSMDLNILIRTMLLEEKTSAGKSVQWLSFRAGSGLVGDSVAVNELHETRAKAKGLLQALEPFLPVGSCS